ncbi:hypothetical protein AVP42_02507 [Agromyces sp. NDB4Y10]|uniref:MarR family winged helix-turn-helix transcriptional regulator n=1 Tax=Agromyces sp. NDB4Y10 TaxID=1775951 RepID=UPI0007B1AC8B|nr:hypothetical protein [Agromyces sp. NDB4Y10]KZE92354.1 hypothetical protein AVP42_02507 [Agromyces sp. NDB4Y10]
MNSHDHTPDSHDHAPDSHDRSEPSGPGRPLGFWLTTVDRAIAREFAAAFDDLEVTRREWRLLNLIGGEARDERLSMKLERRPELVASLVERGWIAGDAGDLHLTDDGRAALATLGERVRGIRSRIAEAVPADDYATTVATLEAIARELGWSEDRPDRPGRRFGRGPRRFRDPHWAGPRFGHHGGSGHADGDDHRHRHGHGHGHGHARCVHDHR